MKGFAKGILAIIVLSILIEPIFEVVNVIREKITINSALFNACRVARDMSLNYESHRDRDAVIDERMFQEQFSKAFSDAMGVTEIPTVGPNLKFSSNHVWNEFSVDIEIETRSDYTGQTYTIVNARAETLYKYKTKYLKIAADAINLDLKLVGERKLLVSIKN